MKQTKDRIQKKEYRLRQLIHSKWIRSFKRVVRLVWMTSNSLGSLKVSLFLRTKSQTYI